MTQSCVVLSDAVVTEQSKEKNMNENTTPSPKTPATPKQAADAVASLRGFISGHQLAAIAQGMCGAEKQFFFDKMVEIAEIVATMPSVYGQDGKGEEAIVYLRYFAGGQAVWLITERDLLTGSGQHQAFGHADLFNDGGELGYISIVEIIANGGEIDLHFTPKTLREAKASR